MPHRDRAFLPLPVAREQRAAYLGIGADPGKRQRAVDPAIHPAGTEEHRHEACALADIGLVADRDKAVVLQQPNLPHQPRGAGEAELGQPVRPARADKSLGDRDDRILVEDDPGRDMVGAARAEMDNLDRVERMVLAQRERPTRTRRLAAERVVGREIEPFEDKRAGLAGGSVEYAVDKDQAGSVQADKARCHMTCFDAGRFDERFQPRKIGPAPRLFSDGGEFERAHDTAFFAAERVRANKMVSREAATAPRKGGAPAAPRMLTLPVLHSPRARVRAPVRRRPSARSGRRPAHARSPASHNRAAADNA